MFVPTMDYGPLVCGSSYKVLEEGRDYVKLLARGKVIYCPRWVDHPDNLKFQEALELEENEV